MSNLETLLQEMDRSLLAQALCGDASLLCQALRRGDDLPSVQRLLADFQDSPQQTEFFDDSAQVQVVKGLLEATAAAQIVAKSSPTAARSRFAAATAAFDQAWGEGQPEDVPDREGPPEHYGYAGPKTLGFWVVKDLLDRWGRNKAEEASHTATTPVLTCDLQGREGFLWVLTVELFPCPKGGPFCPDPRFLGLTNINVTQTAPERPDPSFVRALNAVWEISRFNEGFRGRWRLENPPKEVRHRIRTEYPRRIVGNSAQAAALCAILAASGNAYGSGAGLTTLPDAPEPLDLQVAISASVEIDNGVEEVKQLRLGSVGGVAAKRGDAKRLDTVLFATEDFQENEALEQEEQQRQSSAGEVRSEQQRSGPFVERVETIEQALDVLLITNQYVKAYKAAVAESWLSEWEEGTAEYPPRTKS